MQSSLLAVVALLLVCAASCAGPGRRAIRLEAEDAELSGVQVESETAWPISGGAFVTGFDEDDDAVTFRFTVPAGLYQLLIGHGSPFGEKGYGLRVNSLASDGMFAGTGADFAVHRAGRFALTEGENVVTVAKGWGWFHLDFIEIVPSETVPLERPSESLADRNAGPEARALYAYIRDMYGRRILTGQYDFGEIEYVLAQTGREPAVGGFDLMDYSPSRRERGADPGGQVEAIIEWVRSGGGIVTLSWHWNAPTDLPDVRGKEWWRGFYTNATDFDVEAALADRTSERYRLLVRDMDAAAAELRKFADAGIPVLWRPLHEADGGWFWWGARGPKPLVELWRLMFRRYTEHHGLHNLIWVFNHGTGRDADEWYPGDDFVDVVAADCYADADDPLTHVWDPLQSRFNGRKLVALTETGTLPPLAAPDGLGIWWSWFAVWPGFVRRLPAGDVREFYEGKHAVTRDQLPDWLRGDAAPLREADGAPLEGLAGGGGGES